MILEFDELGCGGKRAVTFAATSEEEDAIILHIHHCFHNGTIKLIGRNGESNIGWVHPAPKADAMGKGK